MPKFLPKMDLTRPASPPPSRFACRPRHREPAPPLRSRPRQILAYRAPSAESQKLSASAADTQATSRAASGCRASITGMSVPNGLGRGYMYCNCRHTMHTHQRRYHCDVHSQVAPSPNTSSKFTRADLNTVGKHRDARDSSPLYACSAIHASSAAAASALPCSFARSNAVPPLAPGPLSAASPPRGPRATPPRSPRAIRRSNVWHAQAKG